MKAILIDHFGDDLAFTYLRDKKKFQMFYLSRVQIEYVIETIRTKDPKGLRARNSTLVLIKVLGMPVTCNME